MNKVQLKSISERKYMSYGSVPSLLKSITVSLAVLFAMQMSAPLAASGGTDFDIPISELNKVKKKTPAKKASSESKKKKKSSAKSKDSSSITAEPNKLDAQPNIPPAGSIEGAGSETAHAKAPATDRSPSKSEDTVINHFPYSFVVADKRTVIHSVINSRIEIKEVNCRISMTEGGAKTLVKMEKVEGTHFTYKAILPPLPSGSTYLRYSIDIVDSQGRNTHSEEFVTPVTSSPVVPSWQLESAGVTIPPEQESRKMLRKNLSAPTINPVQIPKF